MSAVGEIIELLFEKGEESNSGRSLFRVGLSHEEYSIYGRKAASQASLYAEYMPHVISGATRLEDLLSCISQSIESCNSHFSQGSALAIDVEEYEDSLYLVPIGSTLSCDSVFSRRLRESAEFLRGFNYYLYSMYKRCIFFEIESKSCFVGATSRSYTLMNVWYSIHLDSFDSRVLNAENIAHEITHMLLNIYVVRNGVRFADGTLFSPWKNADRPIFNIVHTLLAFHVVLSIYSYFRTVGVISDPEFRRVDSSLRPNLRRISQELQSGDVCNDKTLSFLLRKLASES